jgi:hypothetical protein
MQKKSKRLQKIEEIAKPAVGTDAAYDCRGFGTSRERL